MKCEVDYCVYNRDCACILDKIEIDSVGMCGACEFVAIPAEILEKHKADRLKTIAEIWKLQSPHKKHL